MRVEARATDAAAPKPTAEPAIAVPLEAVYCRGCKRLLCRTTASPLRASGIVETKCPKCGKLNYLVGSVDPG